MARIDLDVNVLGDEELIKKLADLDHKGIPRAVRSALNVANRKARTQISKNIRANYTLKAGRIKQDISPTRFTDGGMKAHIYTSRKPISLRRYTGRMTSKGYYASVTKGARKLVGKNGNKAFVIPSSAPDVPFVRKGRKRKPIEVLFGPSIHSIYTSGAFGASIQSTTEKETEKAFIAELKRRIGSLARGF